MKFILLLAIFCCISAVPKTPPTPGFIRNQPISLSQLNDGKIIGGNDTQLGEFPFQVSIQVKPIFGDKYHHCGGIIINPTHIITAAHCCEGQVLNQVSVVAGAQNMKIDETTQQVRLVKRLIWHDDFDNELLHHDAAVITLTQPFIFNEYVQPLRIADEGYNHTGQCVNTGWGNANPSGGPPILIPDALQKIPLEIVNQTECNSSYNGINPIDGTMLCARGFEDDKYQGSCNGDSGSPLTCFDDNDEPYLAGIVSWGMNPCGQYEYPTVFANVANKEIRDFLVVEGARE